MQSRLAPKRNRSFHHVCCSFDPVELPGRPQGIAYWHQLQPPLPRLTAGVTPTILRISLPSQWRVLGWHGEPLDQLFSWCAWAIPCGRPLWAAHLISTRTVIGQQSLSLIGFLKQALLTVCFTCFICIACSIQTWSKRNAGDHKCRYCVASPGKPLRIRSILHLTIPTDRPLLSHISIPDLPG